jgi:hypothetical protein
VRQRGYIAPVLLDRDGEVTGKAYGVFGTPTSYLIDRQGRLVGRVVGPRAWESPAARSLLLSLLEAPAS